MGIFLGIVAIIVVFIVFNKVNKKIDYEEEKLRTTPGVAQYIRTNFQDIVNCVSSTTGFEKDFERTDYIRFVNLSSGFEVVLQQWSGKLKIAVIKNSSLIKEYEVDKNDVTSLLLSEIKNAIGGYTYWENYKDRNPRKADALLKLTKINMDNESDKSTREIIESIERWSSNTGKQISELKNDFIKSSIETFGEDNLDFLVDRMKNTEMAKEATSFGIDKDHTIIRFMIEALDEYIQAEKIKKLEEHLKNTIPGFDADAVQQALRELNLAPDISNLNNKENRLIDLLEDSCDMLNDEFKSLSDIGRCEALLFFSIHIMDYGILQNEVDMDKFEDRFKFLLVDKVALFETDDIFGFLNARVSFYKKEYAKMKSNPKYAPLALYNAIYENPGCEDPEDTNGVSNPLDMIMFDLHIANVINYIITTKKTI